MYRFLMQIHNAKKLYYTTGKTIYTDADYDRLEDAFKLLHGIKRYNIYVGVGYVDGNYEKFRAKFKQISARD